MLFRLCVALIFVHGLAGPAFEHSTAIAAERPPNILLILADDLGYGDVGCYNSEARVQTPHLDGLARDGLRLTDAHSASTVCTPSRYSLLTGRMCFRTGFRGVFTGVQGPALIEADRLTLPQMLRDHGYATACIGKWHLGLTFLTNDGQPVHSLTIPGGKGEPGGVEIERVRRVDFSQPIPDGPIHRGFDHFFGTACCPTTDWLYAYLAQDRVVTPPTELLDRQRLPQHPYSHDNRRGLMARGFDPETVDLVFLEQSQAWLERQVRERPEQPFFLFHSMQAAHLPSFAAQQFQGQSDAGPHGDFLVELDWVVGELLATLERLGVTEETLVIFTSDNGPEVTTAVRMRADHQHDPARPWRGLKRDNWEGGHRVPFILRWPGHVPAGAVSSDLFSLTDIMATCAALVGAELPANSAEDSFNLLPLWRGEPEAPRRPYLLQQTISLQLAIRQGQWKLLDHRGSGGNDYERNPVLRRYALPDDAPQAPGQLYDLVADPGETSNLYERHPEIVMRLQSLLNEAQVRGRSRE